MGKNVLVFLFDRKGNTGAGNFLETKSNQNKRVYIFYKNRTFKYILKFRHIFD